MSTHEEVTVVNRGDVPRGYEVRYHELRGYDSPDRWYSAATKRGRKLGDFGTYGEAVAACKKDM
jgi:hypothetical protein